MKKLAAVLMLTAAFALGAMTFWPGSNSTGKMIAPKTKLPCPPACGVMVAQPGKHPGAPKPAKPAPKPGKSPAQVIEQPNVAAQRKECPFCPADKSARDGKFHLSFVAMMD